MGVEVLMDSDGLVVLTETSGITEGDAHLTVYREGGDAGLVLSPREAMAVGTALLSGGAATAALVGLLAGVTGVLET